MRILHLVGTLNYGGIERLVTDLATAQKKAGYHPAVCCLLRKEGGFLQVLEAEGIPVFNAAYPGKEPWKLLKPLSRVLKLCNPDLIHSHVNFSLLWQILSLVGVRRIPFIITQHNALGISSFAKIRSHITYQFIEPFITKHIAVSKFAANFAGWLYGISTDKIEIIYNGIIQEQFIFNPEARSINRKEWGIPEKGIIWGSVGRLDWAKGYDLFIEALSKAMKSNPDLYFAVAGGGPWQGKLHDLAKSLNCHRSVFWLGKRQHIGSILSSFDIYVQPSRREGLPLAVLEALSNGLKVVASDVGGNNEIANYTEDMVITPGENQDLLVKTILIQSQNINGNKARNSKLSKLFTFETMVKAYESCYKRALNYE